MASGDGRAYPAPELMVPLDTLELWINRAYIAGQDHKDQELEGVSWVLAADNTLSPRLHVAD